MKDVLLIVIHDRGGSPDASNTAQVTKSYFYDVADIVTPAYCDKNSFDVTRE